MKDYAGNPGIRKSFKVIKTFDKVRKFAGNDADLLSIHAIHVETDGTINLKADYKPNPKITYYFTRPYQSPEPVKKEDGSEDKKIGTKPRQVNKLPPSHAAYENVMIWIFYKHSAFYDMRRIISETSQKSSTVIPPPKCSFRMIWQIAIKEGAPENAIANIDYDSSGYEFNIVDRIIVDNKNINDTLFYMLLDMDCELIEKN